MSPAGLLEHWLREGHSLWTPSSDLDSFALCWWALPLPPVWRVPAVSAGRAGTPSKAAFGWTSIWKNVYSYFSLGCFLLVCLTFDSFTLLYLDAPFGHVNYCCDPMFLFMNKEWRLPCPPQPLLSARATLPAPAGVPQLPGASPSGRTVPPPTGEGGGRASVRRSWLGGSPGCGAS